MAGHIYSTQVATAVTRAQPFVTALTTAQAVLDKWAFDAAAGPVRVTLRNLDATDIIYIGDSSVTTALGMKLGTGESYSFEAFKVKDLLDLYAIASANTPTLAILVVGPQRGS